MTYLWLWLSLSDDFQWVMTNPCDERDLEGSDGEAQLGENFPFEFGVNFPFFGERFNYVDWIMISYLPPSE